MTYSRHIDNGRRAAGELADQLSTHLAELRQLMSAIEDASTMPGRVPDADADGTGRQATRGPARPTERIALDSRRLALAEELKRAAGQLPYAVAVVRGIVASMDRSLAAWEGEEPVYDTHRGESP
ncbi:DUF7169 domain-containing protein [Streptomyces hydrogenans]|uniref:DUF7169 domain-containing protein n=1 Tax=Streptomyces hydrogenans TaxID=1873719 RepID=UPI0035E1B5BB